MTYTKKSRNKKNKRSMRFIKTMQQCLGYLHTVKKTGLCKILIKCLLPLPPGLMLHVQRMVVDRLETNRGRPTSKKGTGDPCIVCIVSRGFMAT